jgi:23S rRNA (pseudouridine1915-N3)-methyltransferase
MKVACWAIGKTSEPYLTEGIAIFEKRLKNYLPFEWVVWPDVRLKTSDTAALKKAEGQMILAKINPDDYLVLLDEQGAQHSSVELARWMERRLAASQRRLIFLVGGAYGFDADVYARADAQWSLSRLTFSHQMARVFVLEQLYRAMTILKNEPYHNP